MGRDGGFRRKPDLSVRLGASLKQSELADSQVANIRFRFALRVLAALRRRPTQQACIKAKHGWAWPRRRVLDAPCAATLLAVIDVETLQPGAYGSVRASLAGIGVGVTFSREEARRALVFEEIVARAAIARSTIAVSIRRRRHSSKLYEQRCALRTESAASSLLRPVRCAAEAVVGLLPV
jgi:hypothetical protein